jgi:UDP-N-acetylmuramoyl-tripeptide--D-alanyl-D-alanine ligase
MISVLGKTYTRLLDALGWRLRGVLGDDRVDRLLVNFARLWRPLLRKPAFIGITGSGGKSTAKELLLGVLSYRGRGVGNPESLNMVAEVAKTILRAHPWHNFCISELGAHQPAAMNEPLALLRPSIGIVTVIANDHWSAYNSREAIAEEKGKLVASLPTDGVAVLNADDPLVCAMASRCAGRVITYGTVPQAMLRAESISATWPARLTFTAVHGAERVVVHTQLCGSHWIPAVLSAIGGGLATGMSLRDCAAGIASVAPFEGRMQVVTTPDNVTFIRDDFKAPLWTVESCLQFMQAAKAKRKIVVIGTLSDCGTSVEKKYIKVAKLAQEVADIVVFVGPFASQVYKARKPGHEHTLLAFNHVRVAAEYINSITQEGDLVMLKGTTKQDHLIRIIMARTKSIACWRDDCKENIFCTACPERSKPSGMPSVHAAHLAVNPAKPTQSQWAMASSTQVIVGLGNPETSYMGTPHNVGYAAVDGLATAAGLSWTSQADAWLAQGDIAGRQVCLVKVHANINETGVRLKHLSENLSFGPGQCILLYDDLDMPIGTVRPRPRGGAGGHRGVASILEAFQTDEFRRVKVGVGQTTSALSRVDYVVTPFTAADTEAMTKAIVVAQNHALEIAATYSTTNSQLKK